LESIKKDSKTWGIKCQKIKIKGQKYKFTRLWNNKHGEEAVILSMSILKDQVEKVEKKKLKGSS